MLPGDVIVDRFELERHAGSGGMGEVFRARDRASGKAVAVKVLRQGYAPDQHRFLREAHVLAELSNPRIVQYVAHGVTAFGEAYLAMEWLEGEDLSQRLKRGPLSVDETLTLGRRTAEALAAAHARGVVHRDLKPSNLFLVEQDLGRVKLLDFGIARLTDATRMTGTGVILGTPGYLAPEQARGDLDLDARADLFALGCVLFKCLTGQPVFSGRRFTALLAKILWEEPPRLAEVLPDVPPALDALIARMLSKDREQRPRDARAVAAALSSLGVEAAAELAPHASGGHEALTHGERRVLSVVLLGSQSALAREVAPTLEQAAAGEPEAALGHALQTHGGEISWLADGSIIVAFTNPLAVATDQAAHAARAALALLAAWPDRPIALATGRAAVKGKLPVGDVIERAAEMVAHREAAAEAVLDAAGPRPVALDGVTAGLLDARFEVVERADELLLLGEQPLAERARMLLGKATSCVGRDWELSTLDALWTECVEESAARAVLVTAPAGMGKSRLGYELMRRVRQRGEGTEIWLGRVDSLQAGSAFGLLGQVLRGALGIQEGEPLAARRHKLLARVAEHVAKSEQERVAAFLGEIVATPVAEEQRTQLRAAPQDAHRIGEQMCRAFVDFLQAETAAHPVLLVLEDLHWGDLPTVRFIDTALRDVRGTPWMVLSLARPEVHELFPKLWAERSPHELRLKELSRKASERLTRQVLGERVGDETMERIVTLAEGHVFYLEELIRAVAEGKGAALPETVLAMVEARLAGLEGEARRVLRAASVFGELCWQGGVTELLGEAMRPIEAGAWIDGLVAREVLVEREQSRFPSEREFAFRHALLREAAYAMLTEDDRALGHRLAGAWLLRHGEGNPIVLAEHFERGGEPSRAAEFYWRAGEQALRGLDPVTAIAHAERGLRCGAEREIHAGLVMLLCEVFSQTGDYTRSLLMADEALALAAPGSRSWCYALAGKLSMAALLGVPGPMMEALGALPGVEPEPEGAAAFACALALISFTFLWLGQFEISDPCVARMERLGEPLMGQDPRLRGWIELVRGERLRSQGHAWAALGLFQRAAASFAEAGENGRSSLSRVREGFCLILLGAPAKGQQILEEVVRGEATQLVVAMAEHMLIRALVGRGLLDEALGRAGMLANDERTRQVLGTFSKLHLMFADIHLRRRDLAAAEREVRAAADLVVLSPRDRALSLATLADIQLAQRRPTEALATLQQALAAQEAIPPAYRAGAYLPLLHAEALFATGDLEGARAILERARAALLRRADAIEDPAYRRSFLEKVPENARTLALARTWLGGDAAGA